MGRGTAQVEGTASGLRWPSCAQRGRADEVWRREGEQWEQQQPTDDLEDGSGINAIHPLPLHSTPSQVLLWVLHDYLIVPSLGLPSR